MRAKSELQKWKDCAKELNLALHLAVGENGQFWLILFNMPDFERDLRDLEVDLSSNKEATRAYHKGLDRARKEIVYIVLVLTILFIVIKVTY